MEKHLNDVVEYYKNQIIVLSDVMVDKTQYREFTENIYDQIKMGFEIKEYRELPVYFKFNNDGDLFTLQLRHFYTNLLFWHPFVDIQKYEDLDGSYIIDTTKLTGKYIKNYIDDKIIEPYRYIISNTKMNKILAYMTYELTRISMDFNLILGLTMNMEDLMRLSIENSRFDEIIRTKLDDDMQPSEIEALINSRLAEEIEILRNSDTLFSPMIKVGAGIKDKQLAEATISGGLKPDLSGQTVPVPINSNLLVGGLNTVAAYYIDSLGGRKPLILNKTMMGKSGHFQRRLILLGSSIQINKDKDYACNSINPIKFHIPDEKHLKYMVGRYYKLPYERAYKVLDKDDKHLIGKTIYIKSPVTCSSEHGICRECYGELQYNMNRNIHIGIYAATKLTHPLGQNILSAKHILTTISEEISFNEEFNHFFSFRGNEIYVNDIEDLENYELLIIGDNIQSIELLNEGDITDYVLVFHVKNNKTGEIIDIMENDGKEIFLSNELIEMMGISGKKKQVFSINLSELPLSQKIALVAVNNNELTRPLYDMMGLLNYNKDRDKMNIETLDDMVQHLVRLLIEADIHLLSVHGEVLISALIRSKKHPMERPDFRRFDAMSDYVIYTMDKALRENPSPVLGLSFQELKKQLENPLTFVKNGESAFDNFFKEKLD